MLFVDKLLIIYMCFIKHSLNIYRQLVDIIKSPKVKWWPFIYINISAFTSCGASNILGGTMVASQYRMPPAPLAVCAGGAISLMGHWLNKRRR